ncbi:MAG TPA: ribonuclease P protein component [Caulobacteraceae bacterium]|nr:ribonuclease P protein component [Caulobacteraceae bacterium]
MSPTFSEDGPPATPAIARLKKRPDFLAAAKGLNCARGAVVAQARYRADGSPLIRVGFTATRRIGGAVVRNRAKRRLREAARFVAPLHARLGCDYVFIARGGTVSRPWAPLLDDMKSALVRLAADLSASLGELPPQRLQTRPD